MTDTATSQAPPFAEQRRRARSGSPRVRAGLAASSARPDDRSTARRFSWLGLAAKTALCGVVVTAYTAALLFVPAAAGSSLFIYTMLALVPLLTMIFVREARTRGLHRWPTIWLLSLIVTPSWVLPVLFVGQTWAVARAWLIESGPQRPEFWPARRTGSQRSE